jgi:hypothetical protein
MMNVSIVILTALLINIWADDGSYVEGQWPNWVDAQVVPLVCLAAIVAALVWRRDNRASRAAFRLSVVTLLACLLNIVPFVLHDLDQYVNTKPADVQSPAVLTNIPPLLDSVRAILEPGYQARLDRENTQSHYLTALTRCIEEKTAQDSSYNATKFECVAIASRMGTAAFIARYTDN